MGRRVGANIIHALGLLALGVALTAIVIQYTWLDSARVNEAAQELLASETVSNALEKTVQTAFSAASPEQYGIDDAMLKESIDAAFDDPLVQQSFAKAFEDMHNQVVGGDRRDVVIDTGPLVAALNYQLFTRYPAIIDQGFTGFGPTAVTLPTSKVPNVGVADTVSEFRNISMLVAVLLIALAFVLHPLHDRVLARTGRSMLLIAFMNFVTFLAIPMLIDKLVGGIGFLSLASSVLVTFGKGALVPLQWMAVASVVLMTAGWAGKRIRKDAAAQSYYRKGSVNATPPPPPPGFAVGNQGQPGVPAFAQGTPTAYPSPTSYGAAPPMPPIYDPSLQGASPIVTNYSPEVAPPPAGFHTGTTPQIQQFDPYADEPFRDTPDQPGSPA
jgi:hypothetical protein